MLKSIMAALVAGGLIGPCDLATALKDGVVVGTWGGENAALIADDTSAHVHIGCTYGNVHQGIEPDGQGHFDVPGDYMLRAYPVAVGPTLPARFEGTVRGSEMQLSVVVTDTTADTTAHLGPVKLYFGREPKMGPCPICRKPGEARRM
jgi:hypothetical protein